MPQYRIVYRTHNESEINWSDFEFARYYGGKNNRSCRQWWVAKAGDCFALANLETSTFYLIVCE